MPEFKVLHPEAPATSSQMRIIRDVFGLELHDLKRGQADDRIKAELLRLG